MNALVPTHEQAGLIYAAALPPGRPERYVAIGGLARAGTSSCERWLHGQPDCFVADEFHGLVNRPVLDALHFMNAYARHEVSSWHDEAGRSWRETTLTD